MSPAFSYSVALPSAGGAFQGFAHDGGNLLLGRPFGFVSAMPTAKATIPVSAVFGNVAEVLAHGDRGIWRRFSGQAAGALPSTPPI
ncbi:MAG: hypothetical protein JNL18_23335 [Planctomycetaceae bacterium]|uniref:Uncharacterized protein n=1 Tax=Lacipirellula limnantheis TaxID=2528024 RepID=A0A517TXZ8_9BACT|nr:hypothetical protein [Lacipirellula limnantheis]MBL9165676.1 hypothetical protein [Planctomycetaceae bacterium]QDT73241.1 hypothetical protein I41_24300 [Lacipirellula limnantheis]